MIKLENGALPHKESTGLLANPQHQRLQQPHSTVLHCAYADRFEMVQKWEGRYGCLTWCHSSCCSSLRGCSSSHSPHCEWGGEVGASSREGRARLQALWLAGSPCPTARTGPESWCNMPTCVSATALPPSPTTASHTDIQAPHHFSVHIYRFPPTRHVFEFTFGKHNHGRCKFVLRKHK